MGEVVLIFVRLVPFIALALLVGMGVYYGGKRLSWWGGPKPQHAAGGRAGAKPVQRGGAHDELPAFYAFVSDIWQEARIRVHGKWLYAAHHNRMLRIHIVTTEGRETLYIEVASFSEYSNCATTGKASVQLFTFVAGKGAAAMQRTVVVKTAGPPDFELGLAYEVAEGTANEKPTDDMLRKLKTGLQLANDLG